MSKKHGKSTGNTQKNTPTKSKNKNGRPRSNSSNSSASGEKARVVKKPAVVYKEAVNQIGNIRDNRRRQQVTNYREYVDVELARIAKEIKETKNPAAKAELVEQRQYWANSLAFQVESAINDAERDAHLSELDKDEYAAHLSRFQQSQGDGLLPAVQLHGGGLPGGVIEIITEFYSPNFSLGGMVDNADVEDILDKMVEDAEAEIRGKEKNSSKNRRFYKQSEATVDAERAKLRASLEAKARKQAGKRGVTPKHPGQLRSWHLNDTGKLERQILKKDKISEGFASRNGSRARVDSSWSPARRALHNQWETDVKNNAGFQPGYVKDFKGGAEKFYKELSKQEPGYVEVNPEGWRQANDQGRLIYDYINDRWFLTTDHYHDAFWEITVPREVRDNLQGSATDKNVLGQVNNCLIDALMEAAAQAGLDHIVPENIADLRQDLESRGLGNVGDMLYADQSVVEAIMGHMGLAGTPVVLIDENGQSQEIAGGDGAGLLIIYHTGALHYVAEPTTDSQSSEANKNKE